MKLRHTIACILISFATLHSFGWDKEIDGIRYNFNKYNGEASVAGNYANSEVKMEDVVIPDSVFHESSWHYVTSIEDKAFVGAEMKAIEIPNTVTKIGTSAVAQCKNLIKVQLSENVKELNGTFNNCVELADITLPYWLEEINGAFNGCKSLRKIDLPTHLKKLGSSAFAGTALDSIIIYDKVEEIGRECFLDCKDLRYVSIGDEGADTARKLKIERRAFNNCRINTLILGETVISLYFNSFNFLGGLKDIYATDTVMVPYVWNDEYNGNFYSDDMILHVPKGYKMMYQRDEFWGKFNIVEYSGDALVDEVKSTCNNLKFIIEGNLLSLPGVDTLSVISIYDLAGQLIYTGTPRDIYLNRGMYIVRLDGESIKIVIGD